MLRKIKYLFIILLSFFVLQIGSAQTDSYILLKDPSGLGSSAYEMAELEKVSECLVAASPTEYQSQFKVIEGAIYPMLVFTDEGVEEALRK